MCNSVLRLFLLFVTALVVTAAWYGILGTGIEVVGATRSLGGVTQDVLYVDRDNVNGPWDGLTWDTAFATVQEGIDEVYARGGGFAG